MIGVMIGDVQILAPASPFGRLEQPLATSSCEWSVHSLSGPWSAQLAASSSGAWSAHPLSSSGFAMSPESSSGVWLAHPLSVPGRAWIMIAAPLAAGLRRGLDGVVRDSTLAATNSERIVVVEHDVKEHGTIVGGMQAAGMLAVGSGIALCAWGGRGVIRSRRGAGRSQPYSGDQPCRPSQVPAQEARVQDVSSSRLQTRGSRVLHPSCRRVPNSGRGDCLFLALGKGLIDLGVPAPCGAMRLRSDVAEYLFLNEEIYIGWFDGIHPDGHPCSFVQFVDAIAEPGRPVGALVLAAICRKFDIAIIVVQERDDIPISRFGDERCAKVVTLWYGGQEPDRGHYELVVSDRGGATPYELALPAVGRHEPALHGHVVGGALAQDPSGFLPLEDWPCGQLSEGVQMTPRPALGIVIVKVTVSCRLFRDGVRHLEVPDLLTFKCIRDEVRSICKAAGHCDEVFLVEPAHSFDGGWIRVDLERSVAEYPQPYCHALLHRAEDGETITVVD